MMINPGDVFSIEAPGGLGYFQYIMRNKLQGFAIRVFSGTHKTAVDDVCQMVDEETNFWVFFPLDAAVKKNFVRKVDNCDIPTHSRELPIFRAGMVNPHTRKVDNWWFWDGEKEWRVGEITEEQRRMPIRGIWNDTLLARRIAEGWLPEKDSL